MAPRSLRPEPVVSASRIRAYYGTAADSTVTYSSTTDLGADNFKQYNDLTINAGVVLSGNFPFIVFVRGTLTLNGTISANTDQGGGAGGGGGGAGGAAAGTVFVFARNITGTGTIRANGAVGSAGGAPTAATAGS